MLVLIGSPSLRQPYGDAYIQVPILYLTFLTDALRMPYRGLLIEVASWMLCYIIDATSLKLPQWSCLSRIPHSLITPRLLILLHWEMRPFQKGLLHHTNFKEPYFQFVTLRDETIPKWFLCWFILGVCMPFLNFVKPNCSSVPKKYI